MGGEEGFLIVDAEVFGYVDAPERVAGVPDAYAVYVVGDSMLERFRRGEIVYVDPHRPPVPGDDVVIQISEDGGATVKGFIKRLVSREGKVLKVRQLNPALTLSFPEKTVVAVHMIVLAGKP